MGILLACIDKFLMQSNEESFLDSSRGSGHKRKCIRFQNIRKQFFTVRVVKLWHMLLREVVDHSYGEILIILMDAVLNSLQ